LRTGKVDRELILPEILREISGMLRNIVTEEEIEVKLYRAILRVLKTDARKIKEKDFRKILNDVTESMFDTPHSINSSHFSEKIKFMNVDLYHVHTCKPGKEEIEEAYNLCMESRRFLRSLPEIIRTVDSFFKRYNHEDGVVRRYFSPRHENFVFISMIGDVSSDLKTHLELSEDLNGRYAVVVPVEKTPKRFIKFYRNHSEEVKKAGLRIWVANPSDGTIDPFIGYPKDLNLIKNFKNPRIASIISSFWRTNVDRLD
jgi:hypothetical protein